MKRFGCGKRARERGDDSTKARGWQRSKEVARKDFWLERMARTYQDERRREKREETLIPIRGRTDGHFSTQHGQSNSAADVTRLVVGSTTLRFEPSERANTIGDFIAIVARATLVRRLAHSIR